MLLGDDHAAGLASGRHDGGAIEGFDGEGVDDLGGHALGGKLVGGGQGLLNLYAARHGW